MESNITNLSDDSEGVTVTFNNSNGLLALAKKGHLTKGRMVHITGHISGITEVYEKDGVTQLLKRPRLTLDSNTAQLVLGAVAKNDAPARPTGVVTVKRTASATEDLTPQVATAPAAPAEYFWLLEASVILRSLLFFSSVTDGLTDGLTNALGADRRLSFLLFNLFWLWLILKLF